MSVVLILRDEERFLAEAIDSIVNQRYENWELILVDDGSGPTATAIAQSYVERFPDRVFYLDHPGHGNRGMSASRNLCIQRSRSEFVAMMEADDLRLEAKLDRQVAILKPNPQVTMVYGATKFWYSWTGDPADLDRDETPEAGIALDTVHPPHSITSGVYPFGNGTTPFPCDAFFATRRSTV